MLIQAKLVALFAALTTCWIFSASAQEAKRTELKKAELAGTNMEVIISVTEARPGDSIARHFYHGEEVVYVLEGAAIELASGQHRKLETGPASANVREAVHAGFKVVGDKALKLVSVHVVPKGKPPYESAQAPQRAEQSTGLEAAAAAARRKVDEDWAQLERASEAREASRRAEAIGAKKRPDEESQPRPLTEAKRQEEGRAAAEKKAATTAQSPTAGPRFRADGRDADAYGRRDGYPPCKGAAYATEQRCRVGAFSHFDTLFPTRTIAASKAPVPLGRATSEPSIRYRYAGQDLTLDHYLDLHPITGFLIAKGDSILVERYQYGRTDKHRLTSFSMAKTITAVLVGIAVKEGAIRSIDDMAEAYVPGLKGTEYGRTPIKALLQMSSGVAFREEYTGGTSDIVILSRLTLGQDPGGSLAAVKRFNTRFMQPGQRFSYSSAETLVLGLVLAGATRRTVSDYLRDKLWEPLGAEAEAKWVVDGTGQEITYAYFNAVLRDWARLGLMLAHDGIWRGKSIVPREWLLASTTIAPPDGHLRLGSQWSGYGYQTWILPGTRRAFALQGHRGQFVIVDPDAKLVLVQTGARAGLDDGADRELLALWGAVSSQLR